MANKTLAIVTALLFATTHAQDPDTAFTTPSIFEEVEGNSSSTINVLAIATEKRCYVRRDVDFAGNDIFNFRGSVGDCCARCKTWSGCTSYTWTNYNGGTCWLKQYYSLVVDKPGAISGQIETAKIGWDGAVARPSADVDFYGNDLYHDSGVYTPYLCVMPCNYNPSCNTFAWTTQDGGTCYYKWCKSTAVQKKGVLSAYVFKHEH